MIEGWRKMEEVGGGWRTLEGWRRMEVVGGMEEDGGEKMILILLLCKKYKIY